MTAYISKGITVSFSTLSAELVDVNYAGETAETQDVTYQGSSDEYREFLAGLKDGGEVTLMLHYGGTVPVAGTSATLTVTFPTIGAIVATNTILTKGGGVTAPLGQKMTSEVTFKLSGKPTLP